MAKRRRTPNPEPRTPTAKLALATPRDLTAGGRTPTLSALLTEQAIDQLADLLIRLPDPDEVLWRAGITRADLRRLEGDDEIAAALETRREALVATPWRLEPYEDSPAAQWVWDELSPHLHALLRGAWSAVPYGYAVQEVMWRKTPDGRLGLARISEKPLEWFEPRRDGTLLYHDPNGWDSPVDQSEKFLLTRRLPTYRQPYGEALLSRLYWPWYFRVNGWQFWARFLERHGGPLLVGKSANSTLMSAALSAAVQSASLAIGRDDEVTAIAPGNAGTAFDAFCNAVDRRVQKVILGQTLTTDVGSTGSFAAAKVHNEVRDDRRRADVALVSGTVQHLIDALCRRNFPGQPVPQFVMADDRGLEAARAERDAVLVNAGVLRLTDQYLLDRYDFEEGDFEVGVPGSGSGSGGPPVGYASRTLPPSALSAQLALPSAAARTLNPAVGRNAPAVPPDAPTARFSPGQQAVEHLVEQTLTRVPDGPIPVARLRAVIAAATGPEDLTARLAQLYGDTDRTAWQDLIERALFTADVLGYRNAEVGDD